MNTHTRTHTRHSLHEMGGEKAMERVMISILLAKNMVFVATSKHRVVPRIKIAVQNEEFMVLSSLLKG